MGMKDLGTLGGSFSQATSINQLGQVTGTAETSAGAMHAFLWTLAGGMQDLGTLGGTWSQARALNALGQVTGNAGTTTDAWHAFLWTPRS